MIRRRPAPSATRTPTSRCRVLARASIRFAVFAHTAKQDEQHDALQRRERAGDHLLGSAGRLPVGQDLRGHRAIARRVGPGEIPCHAVELLRLGCGDAARQASHHSIAAALARVELP